MMEIEPVIGARIARLCDMGDAPPEETDVGFRGRHARWAIVFEPPTSDNWLQYFTNFDVGELVGQDWSPVEDIIAHIRQLLADSYPAIEVLEQPLHLPTIAAWTV